MQRDRVLKLERKNHLVYTKHVSSLVIAILEIMQLFKKTSRNWSPFRNNKIYTEHLQASSYLKHT